MKKNDTNDLIDMLVNFPKFENVFNPLVDYDPIYDIDVSAPQVRLNQFRSYINERVGKASLVLCAEGPGYAGCKFSGIAMTDERVLLGKKASAPFQSGAVIGIPAARTSNMAATKSELGMNELTASVLYNFLYAHDVDPRTVVTWNAFPFHPHEPGNPLSNRAPKLAEIEAANHIHREFFSIFSDCEVISIGNYSSDLMDELNIKCDRVRHPAFGGAKIFTDFMINTIKSKPRQSRMELSAA